MRKIIIFLFVLSGILFFSSSTYSCTYCISCPSYCSNHRYYTDSDGEACCSYSPCCTSWTCGEYGDECCGYSCSACGSPPCTATCDYHHTGTDSDKDGYDAQCGDCDDSNALVNPSSTNQWCDCNPSTPSGLYQSTAGIPETTGCQCAEKDPSGACTKFKPGCLCEDGYDNDCDGKVDLADPDCPDTSKDIVITDTVYWTETKNVSPHNLYVMSTGHLTIDGATLTVGKAKVEGKGKIEFKNGGKLVCTEK